MHPFNYQRFRVAIMAAFVAQDWAAVGVALALIQDVTGVAVLHGDPSPEEVYAWAKGVCQTLAADGAYLDAHGEAHPRLQCDSPTCRMHGNAVRARLARKHAQAFAEVAVPPETAPAPTARAQDMPLFWGPPVPGVH